MLLITLRKYIIPTYNSLKFILVKLVQLYKNRNNKKTKIQLKQIKQFRKHSSGQVYLIFIRIMKIHYILKVRFYIILCTFDCPKLS